MISLNRWLVPFVALLAMPAFAAGVPWGSPDALNSRNEMITSGGTTSPIRWSLDYTSPFYGSGPVIIVNNTESQRQYEATIHDSKLKKYTTGHIVLPTNTLCALDTVSFSPSIPEADPPHFIISNKPSLAGSIIDITGVKDSDKYRSDGIVNGPTAYKVFLTNNYRITSCSNNGEMNCASVKWGSMVVGLANLRSGDLSYDFPYEPFKAKTVEVSLNGRWGSEKGKKKNGIPFYLPSKKMRGWLEDVALLQIQGTTDGSGFDLERAVVPIEKIESAWACSYYLRK